MAEFSPQARLSREGCAPGSGTGWCRDIPGPAVLLCPSSVLDPSGICSMHAGVISGWGKVGCLRSHLDFCQSEEWNRASLTRENPLGRALAPPSSTCPGCHHTLAAPLAERAGSAPSAPGRCHRGTQGFSRGIPGVGTTRDGAAHGSTFQPFPAWNLLGHWGIHSDPLSMGRKVCGNTSSPRKNPKSGEEWG